MIPAIEDMRIEIERRYVGLSPTTRVKPVHVANGLFRAILGKTCDTGLLYRFVISQDNKGRCPRGHDLPSVLKELDDRNRREVRDDRQLAALRVMLREALGADNAVFPGGFESYSAGHAAFVTRDRVGQDGGEFAAEWLRRSKSRLPSVLRNSLNDSSDIVSTLCAPLLEPGGGHHYQSALNYDKVGFLKKPMSQYPAVLKGLMAAADTLSDNLVRQPNKLARLRTAVHFVAFSLMRYLSSLEAIYCPQLSSIGTVPFLLDCELGRNATVATASTVSYQRACQSIARFYAWAFGECLKKRLTLQEMLRAKTPQYKTGKKQASDRERQEVDVLWHLAKQRARKCAGARGEGFTAVCTLGEAIYDILALQAEAEPAEYFRQLGVRTGLLYPPNSSTNRFALTEDALEMLIQGVVATGETVDVSEVLDRLWARYGIIVGGQSSDEARLREAAIVQIDGDALAANRVAFCRSLGSLDFATLLADGVMKVDIGGRT